MASIPKNRLGLTNREVCKSKVKYGNMKSVERTIAILSKEYGDPMTYYRCGESKHYHLTHADPTQRIGGGAKLRREQS